MAHIYRNRGHNWANQIDVEELAGHVNRQLNRHNLYLSDADVRKFLNQLREDARVEDAIFGRDGSEELLRRMKERLARDLELVQAQGLYRSRSRFLVYCYTAKRIDSVELSGILIQFFNRNAADIVGEEKSFLLTEWSLGLRQLEGLVPRDRWHRALRLIARRGPRMFEEWRRPGRHLVWVTEMIRFFDEEIIHDRHHVREHVQVIAPAVRRPRMPHIPRHGVLEPLPYAQAFYEPPLMAPRHEIQAVRIRQHMQAYDGARFHRDVEDMQWNRF